MLAQYTISFGKFYLLLLVNKVGKLWFYSSNIDWRGRHVWRWISPFMSDLNFLIEFGEKREKIVQFTAVWDDKYWVSIYSAILGHDFYFYFEAIPSFITNDDKYNFLHLSQSWVSIYTAILPHNFNFLVWSNTITHSDAKCTFSFSSTSMYEILAS